MLGNLAVWAYFSRSGSSSRLPLDRRSAGRASSSSLRNGIVLGSLYALIALGYSLVYGILKLLNFAHGDVYMVGAFIGYGVLTLPSAGR